MSNNKLQEIINLTIKGLIIQFLPAIALSLTFDWLKSIPNIVVLIQLLFMV